MEKKYEIFLDFMKALSGMTIMDAVDYGRNKHNKLAKSAIKQMRKHGEDWRVKFIDSLKWEKMQSIPRRRRELHFKFRSAVFTSGI